MGGLSWRRWPRADNIALLPAADFSLTSRLYWFITVRSIHSRVGQPDELSSMPIFGVVLWRKSAQDDDVDVFWIHGPVDSLQFLHHLIHAKQEFPRMFSELHLRHVNSNGETPALLESAGLAVLYELGPCLAGGLFRLHDIKRDSLAWSDQ